MLEKLWILRNKLNYFDITWNTYGELWAICCKSCGSAEGLLRTIWRIWANCGDETNPRRSEGSRAPPEPGAGTVPEPPVGADCAGGGGLDGIPLMQYYTALSALL